MQPLPPMERGVAGGVLLEELLFQRGWGWISSLLSPVSMGTAASRNSLL